MTDDLDISFKKPEDEGVRLRRGADSVRLRRVTVLHRQNRLTVPANGLVIGSDPACDLVLAGSGVAPQHAWIRADKGVATVSDLGSSTGVYLNGEHFSGGARRLRSGDSIALGNEILYFVTSENAPLPAVEVPQPHSALRMDRPRLTLGSRSDSDIVLDHPTVSPVHAEIVSGPSGPRIKDLSHGGGGVRVNGRLISRGFLKTGDEIAIGPFRLVFDGELLQQRALDRGMRLDAEGVRFDVGNKTILRPTSLSVLPGELVAIIGASGAGKSTLIKTLCGVHRAHSGRVMVDGEPVSHRVGDLGYVPQDEIVHPLLTIREALDYAAELRLPQDASPEAKVAAVTRGLEEVGLTAHADTQIANLSGGQRKRAGVASELISQPGLLFLDEPTTGLDPGLEQRLMMLFRSLAEHGRATVLVTHATRSLRLCDKVVVMGEGGFACFIGPPDEALAFFGVEHFDDLYTALEERGAETWSTEFAMSQGQGPSAVPAAPTQRRSQPIRPIAPQARTLIRRHVKLLIRDTRNLWILALQVPLLGLLMAFLVKPDVFVFGERNLAGVAAQVLFLLVTVAAWFGALASVREIVKERAVVQRETAVGVRVTAYLLAKAVVLFTLTGAQTIVLTLIVLGLRPLHESGNATTNVLILLVLTSWVGVALGLLVSVSVRSEDQAMSFLPLILIPQLLFGGAVVPVGRMDAVLRVLSKIVPAQWAFAGLGNAVNMNLRISDDRLFSTVNPYGHAFFATPAAVSALVLVGFMVGIAFLLMKVMPKFLEDAS